MTCKLDSSNESLIKRIIKESMMELDFIGKMNINILVLFIELTTTKFYCELHFVKNIENQTKISMSFGKRPSLLVYFSCIYVVYFYKLLSLWQGIISCI